jgi:hypothetical protein
MGIASELLKGVARPRPSKPQAGRCAGDGGQEVRPGANTSPRQRQSLGPRRVDGAG